MGKGRKKGSKDLKPRTRRTKKEIEAAQLTLEPKVQLNPPQTISEVPQTEIGVPVTA